MNRYTNIANDNTALPDDADWSLVGGIRINATGIIVAPLLLADGERVNYKRANELAKALDFGGHTWRAPEVEEGFHIPDRSKFDPAIDPVFFPFLKDGGWFWTATLDASDPGSCAWSVDLDYGYSGFSYQYYSGLALAVRGPVAFPGQ